MLKAILPATILSAFVASAAIAAPAASPALSGVTTSTTGNVIPVAREGRRHGYHRHRYHRHSHRAGRYYSHAPHGWHRHHYRPHDWRTRGCIIVGPVWFCP